MPFPNYSISIDFTDGVAAAKLHQEIKALNILSATFTGIYVNEDICTTLFDQTPSGADILLVNNAIANHNGQPIPEFQFVSAIKIIEGEITITETTNWQFLAGVVISAECCAEVTKIAGRIMAGFNTVGDGAEIRLVEDKDGEDPVIMNSSAWIISNTTGSWTNYRFDADIPPRIGINTYKLEGRLNAATSAILRYASMMFAKTP